MDCFNQVKTFKPETPRNTDDALASSFIAGVAYALTQKYENGKMSKSCPPNFFDNMPETEANFRLLMEYFGMERMRDYCEIMEVRCFMNGLEGHVERALWYRRKKEELEEVLEDD